jgi:hypothetical protein
MTLFQHIKYILVCNVKRLLVLNGHFTMESNDYCQEIYNNFVMMAVW